MGNLLLQTKSLFDAARENVFGLMSNGEEVALKSTSATVLIKFSTEDGIPTFGEYTVVDTVNRVISTM